MLQRKPEDRPSLESIKAHPWMQPKLNKMEIDEELESLSCSLDTSVDTRASTN